MWWHFNIYLADAVSERDLPRIKELIKEGADVDVGFNKACELGDLEFIKYFAENGAKLSSQPVYDLNGNFDYLWSPLGTAVRFGKLEAVKLLHQLGYDFKSDSDVIYEAYNNNHLELLKYLVEKDVYFSPELLSDALYKGNLELVKLLIDKSSDVTFSDNNLIRTASYNGYLEIVKALVEKGADVNIGITSSSCENLELLKYLESKGGDISLAMMGVSIVGNLEMIRYLVGRGVDIKNNDAIAEAANFGHLEVVKYLHQNGSDIDVAIKHAKATIKEELLAYKNSLEEREILLVDFNEMKEKLLGIKNEVTAKKMKI